ncbi:MAG TPA: hypothetical protein VLA37_07530 [Sphingomonadaceae bacterium]|nr:hypothetical protein [Sphingomonadaceae bacterium]
MMELVEANWWAFALALAIGIFVAWWLFVGYRKARVDLKTFDVLDEGAGPARRNQALIDAPARPQPLTTAEPGIAPAIAGDDLTRIKGLGPKLAGLLNAQGITRLSEIAAWDDAEIDRIDALLGEFQGRIRRDSWVEQAKFLAADDMTGFEEKFGKL